MPLLHHLCGQNLKQLACIVLHNLWAPITNIPGLTAIYDRHKPGSPINPCVTENLFKSARLIDTTIRDLNDLLAIRNEQIFTIPLQTL